VLLPDTFTAVQMRGSLEQQLERKIAFVQELKCLPVAVQTAAANEQHYEVGCSSCSPAAHVAEQYKWQMPAADQALLLIAGRLLV
jgi:hypothetical protein